MKINRFSLILAGFLVFVLCGSSSAGENTDRDNTAGNIVIAAQAGNVPEIIKIKQLFNQLKQRGMVKEWELPYENLLTRLTAAIFFFTPVDDSKLEAIWRELGSYPRLTYRRNEEKRLSQLQWRVEFNQGFEL